MSAFARSALVVAAIVLSPTAAPADPPPKFTEEREAAALHFIRKHCPELTPLLDDLKKANRAAYELQVRETFQVTELLAELQDDQKRYDLELKMWKAENKALVLVAKLATPKEDDRKVIEGQLAGAGEGTGRTGSAVARTPGGVAPERTRLVEGGVEQVSR